MDTSQPAFITACFHHSLLSPLNGTHPLVSLCVQVMKNMGAILKAAGVPNNQHSAAACSPQCLSCRESADANAA
jgi:hypothetical protein